ncbi:MAG: caspase family protein, partial [Pseudomonadota bacterium]
HGDLDRINQRGNWLPVDAEPDSTANWISNIQITDILNAMSARQILLVVDSCYSGTLTRAGLARLESGMSPAVRGKWIEKMAEKRSRVVLTSGGVAPVLDGGGGAHSVFARAFLNVLGENTGVLEGQKLFQIVSAQVAASSATAEFEQVPQYAPIKYAGHEAGDFFLVPSRLR